MRNSMRTLRTGLTLVLMLAAISCGGGDSSGGGSSGTTAAAGNVVSVIVDGGPTATSGAINTLYTTVTICVPGSTTQCQTIDHVQVDTQSEGFRVLGSVLSLTLSVNKATDGNALAECTVFGDGYSWGPIASADIQVGGESASSVPIQVIGDANFQSVPDSCSSQNPTSEDTVATFGANGILGIGVFAQDCGAGCDVAAQNFYYYSCPTSTTCALLTAPTTIQVANPVTLFATDNNGTIIDLPAVSSPGATTVTGSLIFGIDTESNNASGSQTVLALNGAGNFTTVFDGTSYGDSIIDSGSNGIFFNDSNITQCTSATGFYCPATTENFSATLTSTNGVSVTESFSVANAETLTSDDPTFTALPDLGGTFTSDAAGFDWGLPFFFGRRVAFAIEGLNTSVGTGPYTAF